MLIFSCIAFIWDTSNLHPFLAFFTVNFLFLTTSEKIDKNLIKYYKNDKINFSNVNYIYNSDFRITEQIGSLMKAKKEISTPTQLGLF